MYVKSVLYKLKKVDWTCTGWIDKNRLPLKNKRARPRKQWLQKSDEISDKPVEQLKEIINVTEKRRESVSYTHLDVYKRQ